MINAPVYVDFEYFWDSDGKVIPKEIAATNIWEGDYPFSDTFLPPCAWKRLTKDARLRNAYSSNYYNNFRWHDGDLPHTEILDFFKRTIQPGTPAIYSKGTERCEYLSQLLKQPVLDLESLGCPEFKEIFKTRYRCPNTHFFHNHDDHSVCAVRRCIAYSRWLRNGPGEQADAEHRKITCTDSAKSRMSEAMKELCAGNIMR